ELEARGLPFVVLGAVAQDVQPGQLLLVRADLARILVADAQVVAAPDRLPPPARGAAPPPTAPQGSRGCAPAASAAAGTPTRPRREAGPLRRESPLISPFLPTGSVSVWPTPASTPARAMRGPQPPSHPPA